ncbi:MAG: hypothetical protein ACLP22_20250 [Solirubrobacteraceae bacterium]
MLDGVRSVRPRRELCGSCRSTHVILPAWSVPRRRDGVEVIGGALLAKAQEVAHRTWRALQSCPDDHRLRRVRRYPRRPGAPSAAPGGRAAYASDASSVMSGTLASARLTGHPAFAPSGCRLEGRRVDSGHLADSPQRDRGNRPRAVDKPDRHRRVRRVRRDRLDRRPGVGERR